jgi:altronate dehydratase
MEVQQLAKELLALRRPLINRIDWSSHPVEMIDEKKEKKKVAAETIAIRTVNINHSQASQQRRQQQHLSTLQFLTENTSYDNQSGLLDIPSQCLFFSVLAYLFDFCGAVQHE